ncbi:SGNH/GDSL hydrolase family protein [Arthrobacter sp. ERGS1:01]|uniref:SGNH/GDSL hydrolase family protein n=1 Tax=Arthrobacter sp. ERGS1:01 TaxID=1704044 RepID=UPI0006B4FAB1|nr:SGNH/GDSL hydrolase family protein [Arthrobacter sp. ERGS1:01]
MHRGTTIRSWASVLACTLALAGCGFGAAGGPAPVMSPAATGTPTTTPATPFTAGAALPPSPLPAGTKYLNPASGRTEVIDPAITRSAVLIGDSQSGGAAGVKSADTWVVRGLAAQGYTVRFEGNGGTGFVARTSKAANYPTGLESGKTLLPYGNPALVVVQGGGNDASQGVADDAILANAARLLKDLKASYPTSRFLFIGTLAKGATHGGGRRTHVDSLLAGFAKRNGLPFVSVGDWLTRYGVAGSLADAVHLNESGHQVLARVLAKQLAAMGLRGPAAAK